MLRLQAKGNPVDEEADLPDVVACLAKRSSLSIGLISDTHIPEAADAISTVILSAFASVDLILHAGDIHDLSVIDDLDKVAPTLAARGNGEEGSGGRPVQPPHPRLRRSWLLNLGGLRVGLIHELPVPEMPQFPADTVSFVKRREFGTRELDVVVYGDTHVEAVDVLDESLCINPGSPTLPHNLRQRFGTIGFLRIQSGVAAAEIMQLSAESLVPFDWNPVRRISSPGVRGSRSAGWLW
jgi:uncharacterized protein